MADYKTYIDFDVPEHFQQGMLVQFPGDSEPSTVVIGEVDAREAAGVQQALAEIASTPEGAQALEQAASTTPDGKISVLSSEALPTSLMRFANGMTVVNINADDSTFRISTSDAGPQDMSIQRVMYHEIAGHAVGEPEQIHFDEEQRAVGATNPFMERYYGEASRSMNMYDGEFGGTDGFDINQNFLGADTPAAMEWREQISQLTPEQAAVLGEDTAQLYALKNDPDGFSSALKEIAMDDRLVEMDMILDQAAPLPDSTPDVSQEHSHANTPVPPLIPITPGNN